MTRARALRPDALPASADTSPRVRRPGEPDSELPPEMMSEAATRLGVFTLLIAGWQLFAAALPLFFPALDAMLYPELRAPVLVPAALFSAVVGWGVLSGRVPRERVLDVALVYQVFLCAVLATLLNAHDWPTEPGAPQWSVVAVITLLAPIVIPTTTPRALAATLLSAATDPLAMMCFVYAGVIEQPTPVAMAHRFIPELIAIPVAVILSRIVHRLGERLARARDMGSYRLIERLGSGGMGEVWRATHRLLRRDAALKIIRPDAAGAWTSGSPAEQRFEREAHAIAALRSAHTVHLYDYGVASDGTLYYVMELLDGVDLQTLVERHGPQPAARVAHILVQICDSLREAHESGLVHRDIKPANVVLARYAGRFDHVKVLDFGLVRDLRRDAPALTADDVVPGTPAYVSPEAATGESATDARADLYSLGCVAYWLLTGTLVFEARNALEMAVAHATRLPVPPSARTERPIPAELEAIVMRLLAKDPAARWQSARELSLALAALELSPAWTEAEACAWWAEHPTPPRRDEAPSDLVPTACAPRARPGRLAALALAERG